MTLSEIVAKIRRGIKEPNPIYYQDSDIEDSVADAIRTFALRIQAKDPAYFSKRSTLFSLTHLFAWPEDCKHILKVWDLGSIARLITGATNESPIIVENYDHPFSTGSIVTVEGVTGNTAANGTWQVTYVDADHFSLVDSTGNGDFTATDLNYPYDSNGDLIVSSEGVAVSTYYSGLAFGEPTDPDEMFPKLLSEADYESPDRYYTRGRKIVVDDGSFTNSIIVDYAYTPTSVSDIPLEYHHGLVSWGISQLMVFDRKKDEDKRSQVNLHTGILEGVLRDISMFSKSTTEPTQIRDVWSSPSSQRTF